MSVGFSAGNFISTLELVAIVADALRESGESSTEFRTLAAQVNTLKTALESVNCLEIGDAQQGEVISLQQAATQCQRTIDTFWKKVEKYQPHLKVGGSESRVRDGWMKIKWALLRKNDLVRFKMDLIGHTVSINILLTTLHFVATRIESNRNDEHHQTFAGKMQESYFGCMRGISFLVKRVSTGIQQGKQILDMTAKIIQQNVQIFQTVLNLQNIITQIPGQINRQQPIYFEDAIGRHMPFHLEFILSAEALTSVLQANFRNVGSGAKKIKNGEFAIQDAATKRDIDLKSVWETCFIPGQHVIMSMVFNSAKSSNMCCPKCNDNNGDNVTQDEDIECRNCNMVYRRSVSVISQLPTSESPASTMVEASTTINEMPNSSPDSIRVPRPPKRCRPDDEEEEMRLFRRVRIKTEIRIDDHGPGYLIFVNNLDPKVNEYALFSEFQARFPSFKSAKMMKDPISGMLRGYGLVRFLDESDQQRALAEMQGVYFGNRPMRVSTATPKSKLGGAGDSDNRMPTPRFDHNEPYSNSIIRRQLEAENEAKFRSLDPYSDPATEACLSEADTYDNLFGPGGKVALMEWA